MIDDAFLFFWIGLAVGEIPPLMKEATDNRNRLFYDLVAISEVFRYRLIWILRRTNVNDAIAYSYQDLDKKTWHERLIQWLTKRSSHSIHNRNINDDGNADVDSSSLLE